MFSIGGSRSLEPISPFGLRLRVAHLTPLGLSTVSRNPPLPQFPTFDSGSKSTLGPHPPPTVVTWPDFAPDSAHFAKLSSKSIPDNAHVVQFWSKFGSDSAHFAQFWNPIVSALPNVGPNSPSIVLTLLNVVQIHFRQGQHCQKLDQLHFA